MMEADSCREWDDAMVRKWMHLGDVEMDSPVRSTSVVSGAGITPPTDRSQSASGPPSICDDVRNILDAELKDVVGGLSPFDLERQAQYVAENDGRIHSEIYRPTLARLRERLGRDLTDPERKEYRKKFVAALQNAQPRLQ